MSKTIRDAAQALLDAEGEYDAASAAYLKKPEGWRDGARLKKSGDVLKRCRDTLRAALAAPEPTADERVAEHMRLVKVANVAACKPGAWLDPDRLEEDAAVAAVEQSARALIESAPAADAVPAVAWQGGLDNEQLRAAFKRKLPAVEPTDRDLSVFALGVEVGESIDASAWNRLHHVLKRHGLHPGRTDDNIIDIADTALATVVALQARISALEARPAWVALTDEDRTRAFQSLPDMLEGFMKTWGWRHFAKAVEAICREKNGDPT